jgi:hypothetical protein
LKWIRPGATPVRCCRHVSAIKDHSFVTADSNLAVDVRTEAEWTLKCAELGYTRCYNIADGFEDELDDHRHRNSVNGWKAAGLPWFQT